MAIKKYSKVKFTLRKELIIILAAIVVLVVATILFNLPNEEEKFLTKWNENGAQITENHLYEEVSFDELKGILNGKGENEKTFVFFATPTDTNSVTYFQKIITYAETYDVNKVYIVDSAFVIGGNREEDSDFDKKLSDIEEGFKTAADEEGNYETIKLDAACNLWVFNGNQLFDSVDNYEKSTDVQWEHALLQIFSCAKAN